MPLSTDVTLPRDATPVFPDRCIRCGQDEPGALWRFTRRTSYWWNFFVMWIGRRHTVDVPCCPPCRTRLRIQRVVRGWSLLGATIAVLVVVIPALDEVDRVLRKPIALGILLVVLAPVFLYQILYPPAFDTTVSNEFVDYEFGDAADAHEFHALNEDQGADLES